MSDSQSISTDWNPKATLIDRVRDLEGICETLVTLPKEVKTLRGRVHKLECIIQSTLFPSPRVQNQEKHKGVFVPQIEGYLQSTSEDEPDIDDETSPKEDENGDVSLFFMPGKPVSQPNDKDVGSYLGVLNGLCKLSQIGEEKDCEHYKYTYSSKEVDQVQRLVYQRPKDHISNLSDVAEQKIQSEIPWLYNRREARLNKIAEEAKQRKCLAHMNSSDVMSSPFYEPQKRKYADVMSLPFCGSPSTSNIPSIKKMSNQKNLLNPTISMIEMCKSVKPWIEDLSRPFKRIDRIFLTHELELFLSRDVVCQCKFPWCNDITVDRTFWNGLCCLDDNREGWLLDEHIDLWVMYLWLTRETHMDWAMVSSYFLPLLIKGSLPLFYANNAIYPVPWMDVERVFIPVNEPRCHWSLAVFHICSGVVTFFDIDLIEGLEHRTWYLQIKDCFEKKIPMVLKETGVFEKKNIDPAQYKISFKVADGVAKQAGVFGDYGVFLCMFLYRLANGIPLALDDPLQSALAYREKMIQFYFKHKMICP